MFTNILLAGISEVIGAILFCLGGFLLWWCFENNEEQKIYYIIGIFLLVLGGISLAAGEYFNIKVDKEAYGENAYSIRNRRK